VSAISLGGVQQLWKRTGAVGEEERRSMQISQGVFLFFGHFSAV
jgi:hypothetical protein